MGWILINNAGVLLDKVAKTDKSHLESNIRDQCHNTLFLYLIKRNEIVNSVCPGWCKTEMGGESAPLPIEEGAKSIVWVAEQEGKTGHFFQNYKEISW